MVIGISLQNAHGEFGRREMSLLIDCIEDGMHFYDETDRQLFIAASVDKNAVLEAPPESNQRPRREMMVETKEEHAPGNSGSSKTKKKREEIDTTGNTVRKGRRKSFPTVQGIRRKNKNRRNSSQSPGKRSGNRHGTRTVKT
mmetsp:Transcript_4333/g.7762  ORF Transcript_4333/g.7762 Transcript_4333/m.7762 type:complete len:142 (-) Transcript_4333:142-567(-)